VKCSVLALLIFAFSFPSGIIAQDEREIRLDPITVTIEEGDFVFSDLVLKTSVPAMLSGKITNKTSKDWGDLSFEITGLDSAGNPIDNKSRNLIFSHPLKKGESEILTEEMLIGFSGKPVARVAIRAHGGEYRVTYIFSMIKPAVSPNLSYKDAFIEITFAASSQQLSFVLQNKTAGPITIDWNQLSYIDSNSGSHKVIHQGVKYMSKEDVQAPSVIPPTARLTDVIGPSDYISYKNGDWTERPLFPQGKAAAEYRGSTFSTFMPLLINGRVRNYLFTFKITDVK
jgi:hypothetical protein